MKSIEHLTENQLSAYLGASALRPEAKHEIGRHLLQCDFCLKRLPQPTPEQFWAALMTDEVEDSLEDEKTTLAARLESIAEALKQPKIFALSAAALAIVLFFSAFIWLNSVKSSEMEIEVAENFETKESPPVFNQTGDEKINLPSAPPSLENNNSSPAVSTRNVADRDSPAPKEIKPKQNSRIANSNGFNAKTQEKPPEEENTALTRGGALPKCSDSSAIDLAIEMSNETVILKWKKIPNAAKYHLYVSDDDEILIDEYETEQGISYALKKPLTPQKIYQWKVVVTLEDGKTIVGDSQKFTIKDLQSNQKKSDRREKSVIRCSEGKLNR